MLRLRRHVRVRLLEPPLPTSARRWLETGYLRLTLNNWLRLLLHLTDRNVIELSEGSAKGDPEVSLPSHGGETEGFALLQAVVSELEAQGGAPPVLSGLKNHVRKAEPGSSEKKFGYGGFLQF